MDLIEASRMFGALGQHTRLALLRLLVTAGPAGLPASEIAARLGMPPSTTSFHLGALERSRLVHSARHSRQMIYSARIGAVHQMMQFLSDTCSGKPLQPSYNQPFLVTDADAESDRMTAAFNVLFLCTKNAARSVMAESILVRAGSRRFNAYSAGDDPADRPMDAVLQVLSKLGHRVDGLRSKSWDDFLRPDAPRMDFVIGLCDTLSGDFRAAFGSRALVAQWPLPDPVRFSGTDVQMTQFINQLYTGLQHRIEAFIDLPFATLGRDDVRTRINALSDDPLAQMIPASRH
jgi:protein-tyrosine-phosphatase/DNA-binding transcriptional ArsR family regulator